MKYYKIIMDNKFIGVGTTIDLRRFQEKNKIFLSCNESKAQYIQCDGKFYHTMRMLPATVDGYSIADVYEIKQDEYDAILSAIKSNEEIQVLPDEDLNNETADINDEDNLTIDYVKESKIKEMKVSCNKMITNGFDIKLSDEKSHHFSLTVQDQLNLITSSQMILNGAMEIPYHADGELCKYYASSDMEDIIAKSNSFKTYHVAYFNSLKAYINSLQDIDKIADVSYGDDIPSEYRSDVYITLKNSFEL